MTKKQSTVRPSTEQVLSFRTLTDLAAMQSALDAYLDLPPGRREVLLMRQDQCDLVRAGKLRAPDWFLSGLVDDESDPR